MFSAQPLTWPLLLGLCAVSAAATAWRVLSPAQPPLPGLHAPQLQGVQPWQPLPTSPPERGRALSRGTGHHYRWSRLQSGQHRQLDLEVLPVRWRRHGDMGLDASRSLLGRSPWRGPVQQLETLRLNGDALALVQQDGQLRLQTCVVPGLRAATDQADLVAMVRQPPGPVGRLRSLLGLEPPRQLECLLVSLSGTGSLDSSDLLAAWRQLRPLLRVRPGTNSPEPPGPL